jgi:signal peptidase
MRRYLRIAMKKTAGLLAGLAVASAVAYAALVAAGYRPVVVYSGSMEPALGASSLAFVESVPATRVDIGDVVTFADPYQPGRLVTHRIVEVVERPEGGLAYRTKGDANTARDPWTIALPRDAGRLAFDVPYAGYALWYAKTREARTALVIVVALLILGALVNRIWRPQGDHRAEPQALPAPGEPETATSSSLWIEALTR